MTVFSYADGDTMCEGFIALPDGAGPHPVVLIAHNWAGQGEADNDAATKLAAAGFAGIAIDVYGKGVRGDLQGDNSALMGPWMADRAALRQRLLAAVDAAAADSRLDAGRMAVMGYCFGGLCALDLARSADPRIKAAVSFHGAYAPDGLGETPKITAKVLVLDGWLDPICPLPAKNALCEELEAAEADWQFLSYGRTYHAFTNRGAANPAGGMQFNDTTDRRSWAAMLALMTETLA